MPAAINNKNILKHSLMPVALNSNYMLDKKAYIFFLFINYDNRIMLNHIV